MSDRDEELDNLQDELKNLQPGGRGKPFVQRPETMDNRNGVLCWLDGSRRCGADCVAFNPEQLDEHGLPGDSPNKCLVLTYMGQQGSAALALIAATSLAAKKSQDAKRHAAGGGMPPPPVVGKKT
jgi:hypothetical protein